MRQHPDSTYRTLACFSDDDIHRIIEATETAIERAHSEGRRWRVGEDVVRLYVGELRARRAGSEAA